MSARSIFQLYKQQTERVLEKVWSSADPAAEVSHYIW